MLWAGHIYPEDITIILPKNEQQYVMCHVQRYDPQNSEFDVNEMATPQRRRHNQIKWMVVLWGYLVHMSWQFVHIAI